MSTNWINDNTIGCLGCLMPNHLKELYGICPICERPMNPEYYEIYMRSKAND